MHQSNTLILYNLNSYKGYFISNLLQEGFFKNSHFDPPILNPILESTWTIQYLPFEEEWNKILTFEPWTWLVSHNHMSFVIIKPKWWLYPWDNIFNFLPYLIRQCNFQIVTLLLYCCTLGLYGLMLNRNFIWQFCRLFLYFLGSTLSIESILNMG